MFLLTIYIYFIILCVQILPHPSFVYCATFCMNTSEIITGCYDRTIRIWKSISGKINSKYELIQELTNFDGYITSICTLKNKATFYSSDSSGIIKEWSFKIHDWILKRFFIYYVFILFLIKHIRFIIKIAILVKFS